MNIGERGTNAGMYLLLPPECKLHCNFMTRCLPLWPSWIV